MIADLQLGFRLLLLELTAVDLVILAFVPCNYYDMGWVSNDIIPRTHSTIYVTSSMFV